MYAHARSQHSPGNRGGGAAGALAPPTLDCRCRSFLFLFVFARELRPLPQKIVGEIRCEVFSFWVGVTLDPRETFCLPSPPTSKIVPGPLGASFSVHLLILIVNT